MSKYAVVYWSGTGNTEKMAFAVAEGIRAKGAEVGIFHAAEFNPSQTGDCRHCVRLPIHGGGGT